MGFMATSDCYDVEDIAGKVIPNIAGNMLDKEKCVEVTAIFNNLLTVSNRLVRDQAFKAIELFIKKLETHAANMVSQPSYLVIHG